MLVVLERTCPDSAEIPYGGGVLAPETVYYVRVIAGSSRGERALGPVSVFETGPDETLFRRGWVWTPGFSGGTQLFRREFCIPKETAVRRARLYVCGLGCHDVYLNGKRVGEAVLQPAVTEYARRVFYCSYDVTDLLREGGNGLGIELGYGWFGGRKLCEKFCARLADGGEVRFGTEDCDWLVSGSPRVKNGIYDGEVYDTRLEERYPSEWSCCGFPATVTSGWMFPVLTSPPEGRICPQSCDPIRAEGEFPGEKISAPAAGVGVYDVGQNLSGWARILVKGRRGSKITLRYAERLGEDGLISTVNLRSAACTDIYILKGEGTEQYNPRFTYHDFRYVQAEIEGEAEILSLSAEHVRAAMEPTGEFCCSSGVLNCLHRMAVWTEANNQIGTLTDCPQRDERFGWLNDWSVRLFQTVFNFSAGQMFGKILQDIADGQDEEGTICDTAPMSAGARPADPVCVSYLLLGKMCRQYYGDDSRLRQAYPGLKKWVDFLLRRQKNYVMDYAYYADWVAAASVEEHCSDPIFVSSVFLLWHLDLIAEIAGYVGEKKDAAFYRRHAERARRALDAKYRRGSGYGNGTQGEAALALSLGLVPEGLRAEVVAELGAKVRKCGWHSSCGNQSYRHLFYALGEGGYADDVIRILVNPEYPGWGYMLARGATTVWERWEDDLQGEMNSYDHPMFGSYDAWFFYRRQQWLLCATACQKNHENHDKVAVTIDL